MRASGSLVLDRASFGSIVLLGCCRTFLQVDKRLLQPLLPFAHGTLLGRLHARAHFSSLARITHRGHLFLGQTQVLL